MHIIDDRPPNFGEIVEVFPNARRSNVIFTYGDAIYAPGRTELHPALIAHEEIHSKRQGTDADGWWQQYLVDQEFRFQEELLAHAEEYHWWRQASRTERRLALKAIARRLSSPLYGNMISFDHARRLLK